MGEAFMVIDDEGAGEAQLMIDGQIVAHVALAIDSASGQTITTTWLPHSVSHSPETIAEMMRVDLLMIVVGSIPEEFKCSAWGKKCSRLGSTWQ
jgi:hypothetical protein